MIGRYPGEVVQVTSALLTPFILIFGLYVIAHGHYGPGGGFAGGVVLAVGAVLVRLTADEELSARVLPPWVGLAAGGAGMLLFLATALAPMVLGAPFLDYAGFAADPAAEVEARYLGILVVEIAVGLAVFGTILLIFEALTAWARVGSRDAEDRP